jgi:biofilm PGA synthesis N-glycosyltransferase PgaC
MAKGLEIFNIFILWYFICMSAGYLILLGMSLSVIFRAFQEQEHGKLISLMKSNMLPPVTAIIPAYNMENSVVDAVFSVLKCEYLGVKVIVVNDGSKDKTLEKLQEVFNLKQVTCIVRQKLQHEQIKGYYISKSHNVVVIDKPHKGVGSGNALNAGLDACQTPLFATVDADTIIEPDSFNKLIFSMLNNPHSVSSGGAVYILNECKQKDGIILEPKLPSKFVLGFQACEYLRSLLVGRSGFNKFGGTLIHSGAFTLFERQAVMEVNGFQVNNFGPDVEVITHLHAYMSEKKYPYNIHYYPSSVAWTDAPVTLKAYLRQRVRWQFAILKSLGTYKRMMFNPKYGVTGLFTYPYYVLFEAYGGPVETAAYASIILAWLLGIWNVKATLLFILIAWGFIAFLTGATGLISYLTFNKYGKFSDVIKISILGFAELFGFRQLSAICRTYATLSYFTTNQEKEYAIKEKEKERG